jgi:soluble lytic murein transglycosylase-like protein
MINSARMRLGRIFWRPAGLSGLISIVLLLPCLVIGSIQPASAEPFVRVRKDGVIYYYFSNRPSNKPSATRLSRRNQLPRPLGRHRPAPSELEPLIQEISQRHNLPPSLIKAVIRVESNFNPAATSPKGAQGLMQLMPGTADDLQVVNPYDAQENIGAGTRYLKMLLEKFNYRLPLALAAYNAGPNRVDKHQDVPPIRETKDFVRNVCENFVKYSGEQNLKKTGDSLQRPE